MLAKAEKIASYLKAHKEVKLVSHIDADGIASAAIASTALSRANVEHSIEFVKQLDECTIERLKNESQLIWFADLGSGVIEYLEDLRFIITDHHKPVCASSKVIPYLIFIALKMSLN
ncbi:MAG: hypothetical protein QMC98_01250 [Candidatus Thermoplasmatota archaeon]|nr:hypothetical protein [Candidatus Thermoplasmatota archaeon]